MMKLTNQAKVCLGSNAANHGALVCSYGGDRAACANDMAWKLPPRLWQLDSKQRHGVLGVCLGPTEVRRQLLAHYGLPAECEEGEIRDIAAARCARCNALSKSLQCTLDRRYALWLGRFAKAETEPAVLAAWQAAIERGDVAGALWGVLTCKAATSALRRKVLADVQSIAAKPRHGRPAKPTDGGKIGHPCQGRRASNQVGVRYPLCVNSQDRGTQTT